MRPSSVPVARSVKRASSPRHVARMRPFLLRATAPPTWMGAMVLLTSKVVLEPTFCAMVEEVVVVGEKYYV